MAQSFVSLYSSPYKAFKEIRSHWAKWKWRVDLQSSHHAKISEQAQFYPLELEELGASWSSWSKSHIVYITLIPTPHQPVPPHRCRLHPHWIPYTTFIYVHRHIYCYLWMLWDVKNKMRYKTKTTFVCGGEGSWDWVRSTWRLQREEIWTP